MRREALRLWMLPLDAARLSWLTASRTVCSGAAASGVATATRALRTKVRTVDLIDLLRAVRSAVWRARLIADLVFATCL